VEQIISETKSNVDHHVQEGKQKVNAGTEIAKRCHELLDQILDSVKRVDGMVIQIAKSSAEQSQGVAEINKAMNQLDSATHQNTTIAHQEASTSVQLEKGALQLEEMVRELLSLVKGSSSGEGTAPAPKRSSKKSGSSAAKVAKEPKAVVAEAKNPAPKVNLEFTPKSDDDRFEDL
jgi:methyl-accepting chemotaxis protein